MEPFLTVADAEGKDIKQLSDFTLDLEFGVGGQSQDFVATFAGEPLEGGTHLYIDATEYGGIVDQAETISTSNLVSYTGRTWHGVLAAKIVEPPAGQSHWVVSGDLNSVIAQAVSRCNVGTLFKARTSPSDLSITNFQFDRYCDLYSGLVKACDAARAKLCMAHVESPAGGYVELWAEPQITCGEGQADSDVMEVGITARYRSVNHLVCLGKGEGTERTILHLYADAAGNVSRKQTFTGVDEVATTYDFNNAEADELEEQGTERLQDLQGQGAVEANALDAAGYGWRVGDRLSAVDYAHNRQVTAPIVGVVAKVERGVLSVSYDVGDAETAVGAVIGPAATQAGRDALSAAQQAAEAARQAEAAKDAANKAVMGTETLYSVGESAPSERWTAEPPTWEPGTIYWQKTVTTYGDGSKVESAPVRVTGNDGADGESGVGIAGTYQVWQLSTTEPTKPSVADPTGWLESMPDYVAGTRLWTATRTDFTDETFTWSSVREEVAWRLSGVAGDHAASAQERAAQAEAAAIEAKQAADDATSTVLVASERAEEAYTLAGQAQATADASKADAEQALKDIASASEELTGSIEAVKTTLTAEYSKKTDLTEATATLQNSIEQSAAGTLQTVAETYARQSDLSTVTSELATLSSQTSAGFEQVASRIDTVSGEVSGAAQIAADAAKAAGDAKAAADAAGVLAATAETAAQTAQSAANQATSDLVNAQNALAELQGRADASDAEIEAAKQAVESARASAAEAATKASAAQEQAELAQANAEAAQAGAETAQAAADAAQADADALAVRVTAAESSITQTAEGIRTEVSQTVTTLTEQITAAQTTAEAATDAAATAEQQAQQVAADLAAEADARQAAIDAAADAARADTDELAGRLDAATSTMTTQINQTAEKLELTASEVGNLTTSLAVTPEGVTIGRPDSTSNVFISDGAVEFRSEGATTATASGGAFVAPTVQSTNLFLGGFAFVARPDGSLSLKWVGDEGEGE